MRKDLLFQINETKQTNIRIKRDRQIKKPKPAGVGATPKPPHTQPASQTSKSASKSRSRKKEWKGTLILATTLLVAYIMYVTLFVM
jgi:hypothetical protein